VATDEGPVSEVDATGLTCPMPVIELSQAVEAVEVGAVVRLLATDPTSRVDVPVWCRMRRHRLLSLDEDVEAGVLRFLVERRH
jgi:tRNA 2-thiouridine synthesizing protein A